MRRPDPVPAPFVEETSIERTTLGEILDHRLAFSAETSLQEVHRLFNESHHTYAAILRDKQAIGLCSREVVAFLLQEENNLKLYHQEPVAAHILPNPLFMAESTPLSEALPRAFARTGAEFLHHLIVVKDTDAREFVGLISVRNLVQMQSKLLREQLQKLGKKEDLLRQTIQQQFRNTVELRRAQNRDNNYKQMLRQTVQQQFRTTMELRRSQARYTMLFENSGVGVALMTSEARITTTNRFLATLLGLPDNLISDPIDFGSYLAPSHRQEFIDTLKKQEAAGEKAVSSHLEFPVQLTVEKESIFHFTLNFIPETSQHCVCVADVTEERRLAKHLVQKEKDVLLESFVGGIAHELNNKVLPLLGFTELLTAETSSGEMDPARIQHYGEIIKKSSSDCAAIVRQLLALCKPVSGEIAVCDLRAVTKEAISFLLFRLRESSILIKENYPPEGVPIFADPNQIKQAIINLALNAIDAMQDAATRNLSLNVTALNGAAILEVQDTGHGIPAEILPRIFDPFFTTKKAETARGLGLSVSRSIARQSKGEITVQSTPGQGALFSLRLPLHHAEPLNAPTAPLPLVPVLSLSDKPLRVLIVDDEEFVGNLVKEVLKRKLKAESDRAANGQEGVEKIRQGDYDLIISDVRMPVMSGADFLKWTRENRPELLSRFFFITGHEGSSANTDEISRSGLPVLRKPFTMDALVATCQKVLRQPQAK